MNEKATPEEVAKALEDLQNMQGRMYDRLLKLSLKERKEIIERKLTDEWWAKATNKNKEIE
jgi:hypothetical protein